MTYVMDGGDPDRIDVYATVIRRFQSRFRSRHRGGRCVIFTAMRFLSTSGRIAYGAENVVLYGHISMIWFRFRQAR